jgi:hypothetical protein
MAQSSALQAARTSRVLIIGRMQAVIDDILEQFAAVGVDGRGTTDAERAAELFDARDFDLIVFGSGLVGPVSDNLRLELSYRNPAIRFVETFAPVAVKQAMAALEGRRTRHAIGFRVTDEADGGYRVQAVILQSGTVRVDFYRLAGGQLASETVEERAAAAGPYELVLGPERRGGFMLMLTVNGEEFHVFRMTDGRVMNRG